MAIEDPFRLVGTVLVGTYRVDRAVASGGFGVVYQGEQLSLRRPVAIKVLWVPNLAKKQLEDVHQKFHQEGVIIARLRHPAILHAIDLRVSMTPAGVEAPWMVLEWLEGMTLRQWRRARAPGPMSPKHALELMKPIFEALAVAHKGDVAHRDVKPTNIMVLDLDPLHGPQVKLMDFGIAKLMESGATVGSGGTRTASEFPTFTPSYGAAEQARGVKTGPWTDVHAMGLIMTELLVGHPAYTEREQHQLTRQILSVDRPTPGHFGVNVGGWERVLKCALDTEPNRRFPNAQEFLRALEAALPPEVEAYERTTRSARPAEPTVLEPQTTPVTRGRPPLPTAPTEVTVVPPSFASQSVPTAAAIAPTFVVSQGGAPQAMPHAVAALQARRGNVSWISGAAIACLGLVGGIGAVWKVTAGRQQSAQPTIATAIRADRPMASRESPRLPPPAAHTLRGETPVPSMGSDAGATGFVGASVVVSSPTTQTTQPTPSSARPEPRPQVHRERSPTATTWGSEIQVH